MKRVHIGLAICLAAAIIGGGSWLVARGLAGPRPELLAHGRFAQVPVYVPAAAPTAVVLLFSAEHGWDPASLERARALRADGALVVGIDLPELEANLDADDDDCVFPDGDLENLSRFLQAYYRLPAYLPPILVGDGEGAAFAYAMLAQAPKGTFAGAVGLDFRPSLALRKPLCRGSGVEFRARADGRGVDLAANLATQGRWIAVRTAGFSRAERTGAMLAAFADVRATMPVPVAAETGGLGDLPLTEMPATAGGGPDAFAIFLSGDGGWAGLDKEVAAALVSAGVPVVGLDSLRYFWGARTPQGLASDLDRMIRHYRLRFARRRVLLIGYSQGADVLPFAMNRLPAASRSAVALVAMMGLSEHAVFEFHLTNWVSDDDSGLPTRPEVARITQAPLLCVYGKDEDDSACPKLDPAKVHLAQMPGGHHFGGDYAALARLILAHAGS